MRRTGWNGVFFFFWALMTTVVVVASYNHLVEVFTNAERLIVLVTGLAFMGVGIADFLSPEEGWEYRKFVEPASNLVLHSVANGVQWLLGLLLLFVGMVVALLAGSDPENFEKFSQANGLYEITSTFVLYGVLISGCAMLAGCRYKLCGDAKGSTFWIFPWFRYKFEQGYVHVP